MFKKPWRIAAIGALALALLFPIAIAVAQPNCPAATLVTGQILTADQWNLQFNCRLGRAGDTMLGLLGLAPSSSRGSVNFPVGAAPSSPNDGDVWMTTAGLSYRVNGSNVGPIAYTTFSGGSTGLTPSSPTAGAITLGGTLGIANGGTGLTSMGAGVQTFLFSPTSLNLLSAISDETGSGSAVFNTNPALSAPAITGGTIGGLTSFGIRNAGTGVFDFQQIYNATLTANRALTWNLNDAARAITMSGNLTLGNAFTTSGAFALTLTQTGATNVTLPTTGTLATLSGSETFANKSISGSANTITAIPLSAFTNLGTTTTLLHGNAAGSPTFSAVSLTADVSGILPSANGGTNNAFFTVSGPGGAAKTFTFPNASSTVLTSNAAVTVAQGGTGCSAGAVACLTNVGALTGTPSSSTFLRGDGAWSTVVPSASVLYATLASAQSFTDNTDSVVKMDTVAIDTQGAYSTSTGRYTPTVAGKYSVCVSLQGSVATAMTQTIGYISKNGLNQSGSPLFLSGALGTGNNVSNTLGGCRIMTMNGSTDTVEVDVKIVGTGGSDVLLGSASNPRTSLSITYLGQ